MKVMLNQLSRKGRGKGGGCVEFNSSVIPSPSYLDKGKKNGENKKNKRLGTTFK